MASDDIGCVCWMRLDGLQVERIGHNVGRRTGADYGDDPVSPRPVVRGPEFPIAKKHREPAGGRGDSHEPRTDGTAKFE